MTLQNFLLMLITFLLAADVFYTRRMLKRMKNSNSVLLKELQEWKSLKNDDSN